jgi:hypothetical protein
MRDEVVHNNQQHELPPWRQHRNRRVHDDRQRPPSPHRFWRSRQIKNGTERQSPSIRASTGIHRQN